MSKLALNTASSSFARPFNLVTEADESGVALRAAAPVRMGTLLFLLLASGAMGAGCGPVPPSTSPEPGAPESTAEPDVIGCDDPACDGVEPTCLDNDRVVCAFDANGCLQLNTTTCEGGCEITPNGAQCAAVPCRGDGQTVSGILNTDVTAMTLDSVESVRGVTRFDVDVNDGRGCLSSFALDLTGGVGTGNCRVAIRAGYQVDARGALPITSMEVEAGSSCPGFLDDVEGEYTWQHPGDAAVPVGYVVQTIGSIDPFAPLCERTTLRIEINGGTLLRRDGAALQLEPSVLEVEGDIEFRQDENAVCACEVLQEKRCGPGGDAVHVMDACGEFAQRVETCTANEACVDTDGPPRCECFGAWEGDNCEICPGNFDPDASCNACIGSFSGDACEFCPAGHDVGSGCTACLPSWNAPDCLTGTIPQDPQNSPRGNFYAFTGLSAESYLGVGDNQIVHFSGAVGRDWSYTAFNVRAVAVADGFIISDFTFDAPPQVSKISHTGVVSMDVSVPDAAPGTNSARLFPRADGTVVVAHQAGIFVIDNGALVRISTPNFDPEYSIARGVYRNGDRNLVVANANRLFEVDVQTGAVLLDIELTLAGWPDGGIAVDGDDNVVISLGASIVSVDLEGNTEILYEGQGTVYELVIDKRNSVFANEDGGMLVLQRNSITNTVVVQRPAGPDVKFITLLEGDRIAIGYPFGVELRLNPPSGSEFGYDPWPTVFGDRDLRRGTPLLFPNGELIVSTTAGVEHFAMPAGLDPEAKWPLSRGDNAGTFRAP